MFPLGPDETEYRKLTSDHVSIEKLGSHEVLSVAPEGLTELTSRAFVDMAHYLRPGHLAQLRTILEDKEASDNDRFVALEFLKNANIAAGGVLPMCQDTGTAVIMGKKGQSVWTQGNDEAAIAEGVLKTYLARNLRYSQVSALSMYDEVNTGNNLPAQIEIYATPGSDYKFLFIAKGGGSANKSFLFQQTPAVLNSGKLLPFLDGAIRGIGTAACPPYHLAVVIGGTSAELTLKTVKLASCRYLDTLPREGTKFGTAFRDTEMEQEILELTRKTASGHSSVGSISVTMFAWSGCRGMERRCPSGSAFRARLIDKFLGRFPEMASISRSLKPIRHGIFRTWTNEHSAERS
jgi:fumarate hydratase class I